CNGQVDEELTQPSDSCTVGVGACEATGTHTKTCNGIEGWSDWGECSAIAGTGSAEVCDNVDNDCDGTIDEGLTRDTTCGVGECSQNTGYETCTLGVWGGDTCDAYSGAVSEICDGLDNDCDGHFDEDFTDLGDSCTVGDGECENTGVKVCTVDMLGTECNVEPLSSSAEVCDGLDNDCDGHFDEDFTDLGDSCTVGDGECSNTGVKVCSADTLSTVCNAEPLSSSTEICDNKDNDCDGLIDEDLTRSTNEQGECSVNTETCDAGTWYANNEYTSTLEICDNLDNDCDGLVDEELTQSCGDGVCAGTSACSAGVWGDCSTSGNDAGVCAVCDNSGNQEYDSSQITDCDGENGWFDGEAEQWVDESQCTEKRQTKQMYKEFICQAIDTCQQSVTNEQWVDSADVRDKQDGTSCEDGFFCTTGDICEAGVCIDGSARDCSANDLSLVDECTYTPDGEEYTRDTFAGFTSVCDEEQDICTTGTEVVVSACDLTCGAECSDGNLDDNDGCSSTCKLEVCGDDIQQTNEQCDDGNIDDNDGCTFDCKIEICSDGIIQTNEYCDDGVLNGQPLKCNEDCTGITGSICGNSIPEEGEECDDGNNLNSDSCTNTCENAKCSDGYVWFGHESCDDGNSDNTDSCLNSCEEAACGDTFVQERIEECDDGNTESLDGCNFQCIEETCGDGIIQPILGETCEFDNQCSDDDHTTLDSCSECGCSNQVVCQDECELSEINFCSVDQLIECGNFDADPCYEYGPKQDCNKQDGCYEVVLEAPFCTSCDPKTCTSVCYNTKTVYRDYTCGDASCSFAVLEMTDVDGDLIDDKCDGCIDLDYDGICDAKDNCVGVYNPNQVDTDNDGYGNACDEDKDSDGYPAGIDCNDWDPKINPGATEILKNGKDDDCNPDTADVPQRIRSQDLSIDVKILNEDSAIKEGYLLVAVFLTNKGIDAKNVEVTSTLADSLITDKVKISTLKQGTTKRVIMYLPVDGKIMPDEAYVRTVMNADTVKKVKYSQVRIF
ncbi:MAG: MopE-related protein, partial [archaeon]